jgi:hypothetical protein
MGVEARSRVRADHSGRTGEGSEREGMVVAASGENPGEWNSRRDDLRCA